MEAVARLQKSKLKIKKVKFFWLLNCGELILTYSNQQSTVNSQQSTVITQIKSS